MLTPLIVAASLAAGELAPTCSDTIANNLRQRLTPLLEERAAQGAFSGVVAVACVGRLVYSGAWGMANRADSVRNTLDTRFNLGSMNKMWTAIAVAQLVEQGKIDVNAPVGRYLPDLSNAPLREQVLVRHLLTHTSGLSSYFKRGYLRERPTLTKASDLLRFFVEDSLAFPPGSRFLYSNAGFAVLGMIVERVSGLSYYDYMKKNVLDRAGISPVALEGLPATPNGYALSYGRPPGASADIETTGMLERPSPAGGAYATAAEVIAFSRALWGGKLTGLGTVQAFTTGKVDMGPTVRYAFGFGDGKINGWRTVGHNGGAPGVGAEFLAFPDQGIDVVVLTNMEMPTATRVIGVVAALVTGGEVPSLAASTAGSSAPPANSDRMPDTPIGRRMTAFLEAFSSGEAAMTKFIGEQMVPSDQAPSARARAGQPMRDRVGRLTFRRVLSAEASRLVVVVDAENVGQLKVTIETEPTAPYRVLPRPDFNPYP
jgi:CubicO group peptidase (beta-lactamase class C family)